MELEQSAEQHLGAVVGVIADRQHELGDALAALDKKHALLAQRVTTMEAFNVTVDAKLDDILGILTTAKNISSLTKWAGGIAGGLTAIVGLIVLLVHTI